MLSYYQLWFQRVRLPWTGVLIHTERFLSSFIITHFSICFPRSYSRLTKCFVKHFVGWNDQKQIKMSFNLFLTEVDYGFFLSARMITKKSSVSAWVCSYRKLVLAQRLLGSPRGKHCNSPEWNIWRKVVSTSKKTILMRDHRFFCRCFVRNWGE